jgi:hypothetical protein
MVGALALLWSLGTFGLRSPRGGRRWLGLITWLATCVLGLSQLRQWTRFAHTYDAKVGIVFDRAERERGAPGWVGVFGSGDLAGSKSALTSNGQLARIGWTCSGLSDSSVDSRLPAQTVGVLKLAGVHRAIAMRRDDHDPRGRRKQKLMWDHA